MDELELYHFTSPLHIEGCRKEGITKGMIPLYKDGMFSLYPGWQWLTKNSNHKQEWCENSTLPYDRTEYRLTINIPKSAQKQLIKWTDLYRLLPIPEGMNDCEDFVNWYVFRGRIKPSWIREVTKKESVQIA